MLAVVIRSFTVTAPVNAAEAALVKVRLLMFTEVPVITPFAPAVRPRSNNVPLSVELSVIFPPLETAPDPVVS